MTLARHGSRADPQPYGGVVKSQELTLSIIIVTNDFQRKGWFDPN